MESLIATLDTGWTLFATVLGDCGIAWGAHGIVGVQLPETDAAATAAHLRGHRPGSAATPPPAAVRQAIDAIAAALADGRTDLASIPLDLRGVPDFAQRVYALARRIPPGRTRSYGELAAALGGPHLARAVGQALGRNPFAPVVPCHRVLAAGGRAGGFSAHGGAATKLRLLSAEGTWPSGGASLF